MICFRRGDSHHQTALCRRVTNTLIRRFVECAQRSLPRDGHDDDLLARRLVAMFAWGERRLRRNHALEVCCCFPPNLQALPSTNAQIQTLAN